MNKITIALGAGVAAVVLSGCGPDLAEVPYGSEEARWQKLMRENYPDYDAPRTAPPAVRDNVSPRLLEEEQRRKNEQGDQNPAPAVDNPAPGADNPPPPANDPASVVDQAAERPVVQEPTVAPQNKRAPEKKQAAPDKQKKPAAKKSDPKNSEIYVVKADDTLGALAQKFYGDARREDVIIKANPGLEKNPNLLKPGMKLVIPKI